MRLVANAGALRPEQCQSVMENRDVAIAERKVLLETAVAGLDYVIWDDCTKRCLARIGEVIDEYTGNVKKAKKVKIAIAPPKRPSPTPMPVEVQKPRIRKVPITERDNSEENVAAPESLAAHETRQAPRFRLRRIHQAGFDGVRFTNIAPSASPLPSIPWCEQESPVHLLPNNETRIAPIRHIGSGDATMDAKEEREQSHLRFHVTSSRSLAKSRRARAAAARLQEPRRRLTIRKVPIRGSHYRVRMQNETVLSKAHLVRRIPRFRVRKIHLAFFDGVRFSRPSLDAIRRQDRLRHYRWGPIYAARYAARGKREHARHRQAVVGARSDAWEMMGSDEGGGQMASEDLGGGWSQTDNRLAEEVSGFARGR